MEEKMWFTKTTPPVPFYLVWNLGGNSPKVSHDTYAAAQAEATRLAAVNPGQSFYVVAPVLEAVTMKPQVTYQHFKVG